LKLGGEIELRRSHLARTNYPLTLVVNLHGGMSVGAVYHRSRFKACDVQSLLNHFALILECMAKGPELPISSISRLTDSEKQLLTGPWSQSAPAQADLSPVHLIFETHAARKPQSIAIEHEGRQLTYAGLNARANQLARFLRAEGVRAESLVGICLERSIDMIVAVLATLKAGGAYVPLDPVYPADRLAFMLDDSGAEILLGRESLRQNLPDFHGRFIAVDGEAETIADQASDNLAESPALGDLAYVIYTSGSTGKPKGVMIDHLALANFVAGASAEYAISPADRVLQFGSLSFDTSVEEIFCTLSSGATLVLRTEKMLTSAAQFLASCEALRITVLDLPTGYWHHLITAICADDLKIPKLVHLVLLGGEAAHPEHVNRWLERTRREVRLLNTYGPTEATVVTTVFDLGAHREGDTVAIGRPLRGAEVYVLDRWQQLVPIGLSGELYIGGPGLARGYLKQPKLSDHKFIANPFGPGRLYRSGDMVRFLPDGNLESLGRVDNQVKIRGFRIELEEVEQAIRSCLGVSDAVVTVHEDADGDKRLGACLTLEPGNLRSTHDVRSFIKRILPAHMIPATWTILEKFPLMPNGKVDRRALPAPDYTRPEVEGDFIPPRTPTEEILARVWCAVLKFDRVGVHDNFFDLGGHSLLAARVFSDLRKKFKVQLGLSDLFRAPTIAELADLIYERETESEHSDRLITLFSELDELSDEEARVRLSEELDGSAAFRL
jgi:amino acid adenylation domain-containing protein